MSTVISAIAMAFLCAVFVISVYWLTKLISITPKTHPEDPNDKVEDKNESVDTLPS